MNINTIKSIVSSDGWSEVEEYIKSQLVDNPMNIKTEGKDDRAIAIEVRASQIASEKIVKALRRLKRLSGIQLKTKERLI